MMIKLMIDRDSYQRLFYDGKVTGARALNDFVSSTRKDPAREKHAYESRRDIVRAALVAAGSGAVAVRVADDLHFGCEVRAHVTEVGAVIGDGLRFLVSLAGGPGKAKAEKGGAE